jgi:hypothetical protein
MMVPLILLLLAGLAVGGYFLFEDLTSGNGGGSGSSQPERLEPYEIAAANDYDPPPGDGVTV